MNCRFVICIPVYDNPQTILAVIEECLRDTSYPVLVVDDGSKVPVQQLFLKEKPEGHVRLTFVRHPENQGKGVALQTGFREALKNGFTHVIAIDGDGQHIPGEIHKLTDCSLQHPWSLVVGDRNMQTSHVPKSSIFGKKFSNFWVRYQTDLLVADSQSGFRVYPLFFLQNMKFFCTKYDFEIEILIRLIWGEVDVKNVAISVKYFAPGERVTHFNKWKDNLRLTVLNTFLTIGSLLREQTSPMKSSLALGIGVFIGTLPLYGLHTLLAVFLSFALRLNFVYLWIGTNVSLPPLIPFLVLGSNYLGSKLTGNPVNSSLKNMGKDWLLGSLALGVVLGVLAFTLNYIAKTASIKKLKSKSWTGKNQNRLGTGIVRIILKNLGPRFTYFFLYFIVFYYYLFSFKTRKALTEYWKTLFPEMSWWSRQGRMYDQILVFAKTLVDRRLQKDSKENTGLYFQYETTPETERFGRAVEQDANGVILVASHIGGWEMSMTYFSKIPSPKRMLAVMHGIEGQIEHSSSPAENSKADASYFNLQSNAVLKMKDYLANGNVIGIMGDRPVSKNCEMALFFGKLALFDLTPFRVAYACKVDVHFVLVAKTSRTTYKVMTFKHDVIAGENKDVFIQSGLAQYVRCLEDFLRQYPEQWFNFFPFWSSHKALE
jgi:predicted LPLAT superfamily acyltransferase/uncharacterized protein (DUF2062 family)